MEQIKYKLEVFEGPLDLLLHLIDKNKVDICDIPIAEILSQFLLYVEDYKRADIDNISEFILMASQLVFIKSKMLLPKEEEEEGDPRDELAQMLLEYKKCKDAALILKESKEKNGDLIYVKKPDLVEADNTYPYTHSPDELVQSYESIFKRSFRRMPPPAAAFDKIVRANFVSVTRKVFAILRRLLRDRQIGFRTWMYSQRSRSEIVAAFLAVLELSKVNRIYLKETSDTDYQITLRKGTAYNGNERT